MPKTSDSSDTDSSGREGTPVYVKKAMKTVLEADTRSQQYQEAAKVLRKNGKAKLLKRIFSDDSSDESESEHERKKKKSLKKTVPKKRQVSVDRDSKKKKSREEHDFSDDEQKKKKNRRVQRDASDDEEPKKKKRAREERVYSDEGTTKKSVDKKEVTRKRKSHSSEKSKKESKSDYSKTKKSVDDDKSKSKETSKDEKAEEDSKEKTVRNFAPPGESVDNDGKNKILWEAYIGGQYHVKLQLFKPNNKQYIAIRKNQNIGANVPAEYLWSLMECLNALKEENINILPDKPE